MPLEASADQWICDANEAIEILQLDPKTGKALNTFHPRFTYMWFDENERIFGYKDLNIKIQFAADDMTPSFSTTWKEKFPEVGDVKAQDLEEPFKSTRAFPTDAFDRSPEALTKHIKARETVFTPPGTPVTSYTLFSRKYTVFRSTLADPACVSIFKNIQALPAFYIEGGEAIKIEEDPLDAWANDRWEVFFVYDTTNLDEGYGFVGYSTVYRYYYFSKSSADLCRMRLSQFIILPPYQRQGHGMKFYNILIDHYLALPEVQEFTVEEPNEEFSDLRDRGDVLRLRNDEEIRNLTIASIASKKFPLEETRKRFKMPQRQFLRCLEMDLLKKVNKKEKRNHKAFRMFVKARIYRHNKDALKQVDKIERIDKLEETYHGLIADYERILRGIGCEEKVVEEKEGSGKGKGKAKAATVDGAADEEDLPPSKRRKRI